MCCYKDYNVYTNHVIGIQRKQYTNWIRNQQKVNKIAALVLVRTNTECRYSSISAKKWAVAVSSGIYIND